VLENLVGLAPGEEVRELVGADEEDHVSPLLRCEADGVDGVRGAAAFQLEAGEDDPRQTGERCLGQAETALRVELGRLVRRRPGDHDDEAPQAEALHCRAREREMPVVRRVERPAEDADHPATLLARSRMELCVAAAEHGDNVLVAPPLRVVVERCDRGCAGAP
jgi:hypothetical protein